MKLADIILWTFSLVLAVIGITFGLIASYSSTKANRKIEELILDKWIHDESKKFFFENLQDIIVANKEALISLSKDDTSYFKYSRISTKTRMIPQSEAFSLKAKDTQFSKLSKNYQELRSGLEAKFREIFSDLSILSRDELIDDTHKAKLVDYHKQVIIIASQIMKDYNYIIEASSTTTIKVV